jgi:hypothetical protein
MRDTERHSLTPLTPYPSHVVQEVFGLTAPDTFWNDYQLAVKDATTEEAMAETRRNIHKAVMLNSSALVMKLEQFGPTAQQ